MPTHEATSFSLKPQTQTLVHGKDQTLSHPNLHLQRTFNLLDRKPLPNPNLSAPSHVLISPQLPAGNQNPTLPPRLSQQPNLNLPARYQNTQRGHQPTHPEKPLLLLSSQYSRRFPYHCLNPIPSNTRRPRPKRNFLFQFHLSHNQSMLNMLAPTPSL